MFRKCCMRVCLCVTNMCASQDIDKILLECQGRSTYLSIDWWRQSISHRESSSPIDFITEIVSRERSGQSTRTNHTTKHYIGGDTHTRTHTQRQQCKKNISSRILHRIWEAPRCPQQAACMYNKNLILEQQMDTL